MFKTKKKREKEKRRKKTPSPSGVWWLGFKTKQNKTKQKTFAFIWSKITE